MVLEQTHKDYTNGNPHQEIYDNQQRNDCNGREWQALQHWDLRMVVLAFAFKPKINGVLVALILWTDHQRFGLGRHCYFLG